MNTEAILVVLFTVLDKTGGWKVNGDSYYYKLDECLGPVYHVKTNFNPVYNPDQFTELFYQFPLAEGISKESYGLFCQARKQAERKMNNPRNNRERQIFIGDFCRAYSKLRRAAENVTH